MIPELPNFGDVAGDDPQRADREAALLRFGHDSVGEHAVVHLAVEGISLLCGRAVLESRLGSFTEKAGRYQGSDTPSIVTPADLPSGAATTAFHRATDALLTLHDRARAPLLDAARSLKPRRPSETESAFDRRIDEAVRTTRRQLLPLATRTDLLMTMNARALDHLLRRLDCAPQSEVRTLATRLRAAAVPALPSLIAPRPTSHYRADTEEAMAGWAAEILREVAPGSSEDRNRARLVRKPDDVVERLVAAILYRHASQPYRMVRGRVDALPAETRLAVLDDYVRRRGHNDAPLREFEHVEFTFEVVLDGVALREVRRHRLAVRTPQPLSDAHGYLIEPELLDTALLAPWREAMDSACAGFRELQRNAPSTAAYVLPLGVRQRVLITFSLRSLVRFVELRARRNGNRSVRNIALDVLDELERAHPAVARLLRVERVPPGDEGGR